MISLVCLFNCVVCVCVCVCVCLTLSPFVLSLSLSLGENFLEEISSLSHSIVFLYFFALITEEGFLIFPCYSLELCIQVGCHFLLQGENFSLIFKGKFSIIKI